jgi:hypothetical protein
MTEAMAEELFFLSQGAIEEDNHVNYLWLSFLFQNQPNWWESAFVKVFYTEDFRYETNVGTGSVPTL